MTKPHGHLMIQRLSEEGDSCIPDLIASGYTADEILHHCSARSMLQCMKVVIQNHGADVNAHVDKKTPLFAAADTGSSHSIQFLLEHGADPNKTTKSHNFTPLWRAAESGHLRVVSLLLQGGANADIMNIANHTPLYVACQNQHMLVAMELLRWGADPQLGGDTPLVIATFTANPHFIALLVRSGTRQDIMLALGKILDMEKTKKTCMTTNAAKVTSDVLQEMQDIVVSASALHSPLLQEAHQAEQKGECRRALGLVAALQTQLFRTVGPPPFRLPNTPLIDWRTQTDKPDQLLWSQTKYDMIRLQDAVYGFENSDGRISEFSQHTFDPKDVHPDKVVFYAWARHGNTVYRYGGRSLNSAAQWPVAPTSSSAALYAFDLLDMKWRKISTTGSKPGRRIEHVMFVYGDFLFVAGGTADGKPASMKKFHRLDLKTLIWDVVSTKGSKPISRCESAVHVYKGKIYLFVEAMLMSMSISAISGA